MNERLRCKRPRCPGEVRVMRTRRREWQGEIVTTRRLFCLRCGTRWTTVEREKKGSVKKGKKAKAAIEDE